MTISSRVQYYIRILFLVFIFLTGYIYISYGCYWTIAGILKNPGLTDLMGLPAGHDFVAFWSASALAAGGDPTGSYSLEKLHAMEQLVIGSPIGRWAWNYPPTFLLMVLPLSLLPYLAALAGWVLLTLAGYQLLIYRLAPHKMTPWLLMGLPGLYQNIVYGQNGFLSAIFMGGGLLLVDQRPFWGGCLLGLLSYKPQLAILVPVALVAGRRWQALWGAVVAAAALVLASFWLFGAGSWIAFWHNLPFAARLMNQPIYWKKMASIFAGARLAGLSYLPAILLQGVVAIFALLAVAWIWYKDFSLPLRGSVLAIGTFLAVPYAFVYDLAIVGLAFAWLGWQEYREGRINGQTFLIFCWLACYLMTLDLWGTVGFPGNPLIMLAMLLFVLWRSYGGQKFLTKRQPQ
jgi:Glycosyltransferase family 87